MKKNLFIALGILAVCCGTLGVFIPGIPTTPFILLASYLFYRSSEKLHNRLQNSFLGKYIHEYEKKKGMPIKAKIMAVSMMLGMVTLSIIFFIPTLYPKIIAGTLAVIGSCCVLFLVPTRN